MSRQRLIQSIVTVLIPLVMVGCGFDGGLEETFQFPEDTETRSRTITFGRVPSETVISLLRDNEPLIEYLENELDVDIQFVFAQDYNQIIDGMSNNEYDFALLGPYAYVLAKEQSEYEAIVRRRRYGQDWYKGIIFTHRNRNIDSLEELKGNSFAFVDPNSASGFLFPKARLIEAGVAENSRNFRQSFSSMTFLGRHDRVVRAVYRGEFAAGATFKDARTQSGLPDEANPKETLPILAETRRIPTAPIVVSDQFRSNNQQLTEEITQSLTSLHETERGKNVLEALGIDRYIVSEPGDYNMVEKVRETLRTEEE